MAKIGQFTYRATNLAQNTTLYHNTGIGRDPLSATEADALYTVLTPGVYSHLYFRCSANSIAVNPSVTATLRVNGADSALQLTVGSSAFGEFEDVTHSVTVVAGDTLSWKTVTGVSGANTCAMRILGVQFSASSGTVVPYYAIPSAAFTVASVTNYVRLVGQATAPTTETAKEQFKSQLAGVRKNLHAVVKLNTWTTSNATLKSRLNGADGAMSAAVTFGVTGTYRDLTHSDTIAVGDLVNSAFAVGTGSGSYGQPTFYSEIATANGTAQFIAAANSTTQAVSLTRYLPSCADCAGNATESEVQLKVGIACVADKFSMYVSANTLTASCTVTSRVGAAAGNGSISIAGLSAAGWYEDLTHSDTLTASSEINDSLVTVAGGTALTYDYTSRRITASNTAALAITTQPTNAASGAVISPAVVVKYTLDGTNVDSEMTVVVTAAIASGSGALSGTLTATCVGGVATFNNLIITGSGAHTLTFTAPGGPTAATSSSFTIGGATTLAFTQQPSTVVSGAANSPSITVQLSDNAAGVTVTMAKLTGTGTLSGTLTAVSNGSGLATFSNVILTGAGPHTLQATAPGYTSINSSSFTVTHTALTAWAAFIAANGGDSAWIAAADYRVNVTDDGTGKASQWDDVRGAIAGAMLPLTQATQAKRYTIGGSGLVGTALAQSHMLSALDSRIMLDQVAGPHAFLIAQSPSGSSYLFGISQDPTDTTSQPYLYLITNASTFGMQGNSGGGGTTNQFVVDQGTTFDATVRPIIVGRQTYIGGAAGDYTYEVRIPGKQGSNRQVLPIASATASGMKIALGRWGATYADLTIQGFGITTQALTKTLVANFETFATAQFSASPDIAKRGTLIAEACPRIAPTTPHTRSPRAATSSRTRASPRTSTSASVPSRASAPSPRSATRTTSRA
jgi:hypothetical protein